MLAMLKQHVNNIHYMKATFGAGCFWHVEEMFSKIPGVISTSVGYAGGDVTDPSYEQVCTGNTGHAESVQIEYDPDKVPYEELLRVFWENHNPTTPNRQGPDVGTQYRSVVFIHDVKQKEAADAIKKRINESGKHPDPIVTQIVPAGKFYRAEEYHQKYFEKNC
ncbi:MAG: Peptide methionine sulfoxide reductase [Cenarchaeum symbiont of Oopsacas minuta]|nr:Peptide methionine sulfoxide reductase [Cenarchaeum symbiont of Oopsacas minuta]